jgi:hypothetical protein
MSLTKAVVLVLAERRDEATTLRVAVLPTLRNPSSIARDVVTRISRERAIPIVAKG